ncbi:hypothetical protein EKO04_007403 [Ascochyta lentis]|uniref:Uncharacterized protein n=1 Tax=Ascochyta lentis TaxID=205686 RepID=A0A8H7MFM7_9PLEO|nr:hypothetical protein EKO04_007403 [Ascochyta lentis]
MNALDLLFDFAALMATSSAMTRAPTSTNPSHPPARESPTPSISKATAPPLRNDPTQQTPLPQNDIYSQHSLDIPLAPQHEQFVEPWSVPEQQGVGEYQHVWTSEPVPQQQQRQQQQQYQRQLHQQHFTPLPGFTHSLPCGHHPDHQCQCAYIPETSLYAPYADAALWTMDCPSSYQEGVLLEQGQGGSGSCGNTVLERGVGRGSMVGLRSGWVGKRGKQGKKDVVGWWERDCSIETCWAGLRGGNMYL